MNSPYPNSERVQVPYIVPFTAQVASPELTQAIFGDHQPAETDPRWAETGATSPQEYAYWTDRACGIACVKMVVEAFGGPKRPLMEWIQAGLAINGYLVQTTPEGAQEERGWIHRSLAQLIEQAGYQAQAQAATLQDIVAQIRLGNLVIASVSYEIGTPKPVTRKGGHLVVVLGAVLEDNQLTHVIINNPSGRTQILQQAAEIPIDRFSAGYTGRIIVCKP